MTADVLPAVVSIESRLSDAEFAGYQRLLQDVAGLRLGETKRALLVGRLSRRLQEIGATSFGHYLQLVTHPAADGERMRMLDLLTTNETHFFREPRQFEYLESDIIPGWQKAAAAGKRLSQIRVWSAGCSTGEEPYSVAMLLLAHLPEWRIEIVATDLSTLALTAASAGLFAEERQSEIPPQFLRRFMLRGQGRYRGNIKVHPEVRKLVRFQRLNLNEASYDISGHFDLVLCRNVLIYFEPAARDRVVGRLIDHTCPGGYLFTGHAETLNGFATRIAAARPTMWVRR